MNYVQRSVLIIMASLICALILYAPYEIVFHGQQGLQLIEQSGYAFIFDLPFQKDHTTHINVSLLATPICGVLLVGGLLYMSLKSRQK